MIEFISELCNNHNGDIEIAKRMIDASVAAGVQYVKFQKRNNSLVYSQEKLDAPRESPWGTTYGEYREHVEFDLEDYKEIERYCKNKVRWFATPFDVQSLGFLAKFKPPFIKVGSMNINSFPLLEAISHYNIPVVMSCGMSTPKMIDKAVDVLGKDKIYCIMQCNSHYPSTADELNLRVIPTLKERYPFCKIGFSNHFSGLTGLIGAVALGAEVLEYHVTMDRSMYGTDQSASIEPQGVFQLVKHCRTMQKALGSSEKFVCESEKSYL